MRILIADDNWTSRTVLLAVLNKLGHEVVAVTNGQEAWEVLQQPDAPRLAILDWLMPELDGPEICRRVRAQESERPSYLILLTIRDAKEDISAGLNAGADDYLSKPFDPTELGARIDVGKRILTLQERLTDKISELEAALSQIKTLHGIIPICASCKNVRDDAGYWSQVEAYISEHSKAQFSHGICPDCMTKLYPDVLDDDDDDRD